MTERRYSPPRPLVITSREDVILTVAVTTSIEEDAVRRAAKQADLDVVMLHVTSVPNAMRTLRDLAQS